MRSGCWWQWEISRILERKRRRDGMKAETRVNVAHLGKTTNRKQSSSGHSGVSWCEFAFLPTAFYFSSKLALCWKKFVSPAFLSFFLLRGAPTLFLQTARQETFLRLRHFLRRNDHASLWSAGLFRDTGCLHLPGVSANSVRHSSRLASP